MYFPFFVLHDWCKRSAVQPQTIYSEFPLHTWYTSSSPLATGISWQGVFRNFSAGVIQNCGFLCYNGAEWMHGICVCFSPNSGSINF